MPLTQFLFNLIRKYMKLKLYFKLHYSDKDLIKNLFSPTRIEPQIPAQGQNILTPDHGTGTAYKFKQILGAMIFSLSGNFLPQKLPKGFAKSFPHKFLIRISFYNKYSPFAPILAAINRTIFMPVSPDKTGGFCHKVFRHSSAPRIFCVVTLLMLFCVTPCQKNKQTTIVFVQG